MLAVWEQIRMKNILIDKDQSVKERQAIEILS